MFGGLEVQFQNTVQLEKNTKNTVTTEDTNLIYLLKFTEAS